MIGKQLPIGIGTAGYHTLVQEEAFSTLPHIKGYLLHFKTAATFSKKTNYYFSYWKCLSKKNLSGTSLEAFRLINVFTFTPEAVMRCRLINQRSENNTDIFSQGKIYQNPISS